jgi:hypothetical protein
MTDKELLELAAKAAGITLDFTVRGDYPPYYVNERGGHTSWNPLTDDGAALRLVVNLELSVVFGANYVIVDGNQHPTVNNANDPYAATRRAIVRAAAEIGKQKE